MSFPGTTDFGLWHHGTVARRGRFKTLELAGCRKGDTDVIEGLISEVGKLLWGFYRLH